MVDAEGKLIDLVRYGNNEESKTWNRLKRLGCKGTGEVRRSPLGEAEDLVWRRRVDHCP
jgi:hypothetical protein